MVSTLSGIHSPSDPLCQLVATKVCVVFHNQTPNPATRMTIHCPMRMHPLPLSTHCWHFPSGITTTQLANEASRTSLLNLFCPVFDFIFSSVFLIFFRIVTHLRPGQLPPQLPYQLPLLPTSHTSQAPAIAIPYCHTVTRDPCTFHVQQGFNLLRAPGYVPYLVSSLQGTPLMHPYSIAPLLFLCLFLLVFSR